MGTNYIHHASPQFHILSNEQLENLHYATLEILEETGVAFESRQALEILDAYGADVSNHDRVKIPSYLVERTLNTAPKTISLYTRDGEPAFTLNGMTGAHFGSEPNPREIIDPHTGKRRICYVSDMAEMSRLIDALPNIEWCWNGTSNLTLPAGISGDFSGRVSLLQFLLNSSKPVFVENLSVDSLEDMIELCSIAAGGEEQLKRKPFFGSSSEPVSPLIQGEEAVEKSLLCAEKGIPNIVYGMPMAGATAPATFAGCLAIANAEILSQLVVLQLRNPGAPIIVGAIPSIMDMKTTIFSYGAPELSLMVGALTELIHYYNLPMFGTAGCTDAEIIGIQAAVEVTYQILITALTGADLVHDVAISYHATAGSPELMVLVNEVIDMVRVMMDGIDINEETLPLDIIRRLGPRASYLMDSHTTRNFRKFWVPTIFDRSFIRQGETDDCEHKLREKTINLMKTHEPSRLPEDKVKEMKKIEKVWLDKMGLEGYPKRP